MLCLQQILLTRYTTIASSKTKQTWKKRHNKRQPHLPGENEHKKRRQLAYKRLLAKKICTGPKRLTPTGPHSPRTSGLKQSPISFKIWTKFQFQYDR